MRVAIFSEVYAPMVSGVSLTLKRTADALRRHGHAVRVYSASYPEGSEAADPDCHASPSQPFRLSPQVQWAVPDRQVIRSDLAAFGADIVHLATEFPMGLAGLHAARQLRLPILASAHTDYERYASRYRLAWALPAGWAYLRWFYGHAHRVLAPSSAYEVHLRLRGIRHTGIWSRGVDTDAFSPDFRSASYRRSLGLGDQDLLVAYVGRLAPEKGIDRLLEAWPTIARLHPRAHLVFTGHGQSEDQIRRAQLPRTHLTGMLRGKDLSVAYASADLFAMPSDTETFGNVTLEAMASGVPALALSAGGITDFGHHGENAWLVDPRDFTAWVTGMDRLLADIRLRRRLARGARATALGRGWAPILEELVSHYAAVIGTPAGRKAA